MSTVLSEMSTVTTQLRADIRSFQTAAYRPPQKLLDLLNNFKGARDAVMRGGADSMPYLGPFLDVIRCEQTSGVVTQRALCAVLAFMQADLLSPDEPSTPRAMGAVVKAATYCRFEVTDPAADEVVLNCILQLLLGCVRCKAGAALSDRSVCELVHLCFRISSQASLSELLRHSAEAALRQIVRRLFSRVAELPALGEAAVVRRVTAAASAIAASTPSAAEAVAAAAEAAAAEVAALRDTAAAPAAAEPAAGEAEAEGEAGAPAPEAAAAAPEAVAAPAAAPAAAPEPAPPTPAPAKVAATAEAAEEEASEGGPPHGVGALHEVLRFLVSLIDPAEAHNPLAVREFGLALLLVALQAGGASLGRVAPLAALLADDLALGLIMNAEAIVAAEDEAAAAAAKAGTSYERGGPPLELLSLLLGCAYELVAVLGVGGTAQLAALLSRVHLALLRNTALPLAARELLLEHVAAMAQLPSFPLRLYLAFDADARRADLLEELAAALAAAATPTPPPPPPTPAGAATPAATAPPPPAAPVPLDSAHLLALDALVALLSAAAPGAAAAAAAGSGAEEAEAAGAGGDDAAAALAAAAAAEVRTLKEEKRAVARVATEFNKKARLGVAALKALRGAAAAEPAALASFIRSTPQLDLAAVGDFLSDRDDFNAAVRADPPPLPTPIPHSANPTPTLTTPSPPIRRCSPPSSPTSTSRAPPSTRRCAPSSNPSGCPARRRRSTG